MFVQAACPIQLGLVGLTAVVRDLFPQLIGRMDAVDNLGSWMTLTPDVRVPLGATSGTRERRPGPAAEQEAPHEVVRTSRA